MRMKYSTCINGNGVNIYLSFFCEKEKEEKELVRVNEVGRHSSNVSRRGKGAGVNFYDGFFLSILLLPPKSSKEIMTVECLWSF